MSRRMTILLTATVTAVTLGVLGAVVIALDTSPTPSIAPMASAESADGGGAYDDPWAAHEERCGEVMQQAWGPTEADLAEMRADNERMMAALDEAGVEYELVTVEDGWEHLEPTDGNHEAFEQALEDFWGSPEGGPDQEHLAVMREENKALAAHLEEQGIEYEIVTDPDGWEHVEPTGDDGWEAMESFWHTQERENLQERAAEQGLDVDLVLDCFEAERELSGMFDGFDPFPLPMDMRMASEQKAMVEALMAAFDEAGIDYQRLDVPFVQWDREDEAAASIVEEVAAEHGYEMGYDGGMMMEEEVIELGEAEAEAEAAG